MPGQTQILENNAVESREWYADIHISTLLEHYLGKDKQIDILAPLPSTGEGAAIISEALKDYSICSRALDESKLASQAKVLAPINTGNHWVIVCLSFDKNEIKPSSAFYFNPKGNPINEDIEIALKAVYGNVDIKNSTVCYQPDDYNCGPWIVEAARALARQQDISEQQVFASDIDIELARKQHNKILKSIPNSSIQSHIKTNQSSLILNNDVLNSGYAELLTIEAETVNTLVIKLLDDALESGKTKEVETFLALGESAYGELKNPADTQKSAFKQLKYLVEKLKEDEKSQKKMQQKAVVGHFAMFGNQVKDKKNINQASNTFSSSRVSA